MKNVVADKKYFFIVFFLFILVGFIYAFSSQKIYLSKSQVALFRYKIPDPDADSEETKNRWIWIRDGLNLKSALITDELIKGFVETNALAKEFMIRSPNPQSGLEHIKQMINVQFTGADENNYIIEVKSIDPAFSHDLNQLIFMRLKYLAVDAAEADFNALISQLKEHLSQVESRGDEYNFYQEKIRKLIFRNTLEKAQRERAYQVLIAPTENSIPIWPKKGPVIILFLFCGILFGLFAEYVRYLIKAKTK